MGRFKNILVAASPGRLETTTFRDAAKLAETDDAQLTVMDVIAPLPAWRKKMTLEGQVIDVEAALLRDREELLQRLVKTKRDGPNTDVLVKVGEPFLEVIRQVMANGHDLVMVGEPRSESGPAGQLSSGVMHLLRKCPVPVWVMRPSRARKLRILALVDPDPDDPVRDGLNDLVLELATSMTRREHAELHVGHAWTLTGETTLRSSPFVGISGEIVDVMVETVEATSREHLAALMERHQVADIGGSDHMVAGDPRVVLPRMASQLNIGLIVMGTVARTGLSGLIMGNTAEDILRSVECSVLAVKPEGFVTPVKPARHHT